MVGPEGQSWLEWYDATMYQWMLLLERGGSSAVFPDAACTGSINKTLQSDHGQIAFGIQTPSHRDLFSALKTSANIDSTINTASTHSRLGAVA